MIKDWKIEFDKEFPHLYMEVHNKNVDDDIVEEKEQEVKQFISTLLLQQQEEMVKEIENTLIEKAHTYSSENADVYRAYDKGQEDYKNKLLTTLKSKNKE